MRRNYFFLAPFTYLRAKTSKNQDGLTPFITTQHVIICELLSHRMLLEKLMRASEFEAKSH